MRAHPHGIVVYPNRLRLLGFAVFSTMIFTATFSLRDPSNAQGDPRYYAAIFCCLPLFGIMMLFFFARALRPGPSLVINEDGVLDRVSGPWPDGHLVPWSDIAALDILTIRQFLWKERRLIIFLKEHPSKNKGLLARLRWRGAMMRRGIRTTGVGGHLYILQPFLDTPIPELLHEIERLYPAQLQEHGIVVDADG